MTASHQRPPPPFWRAAALEGLRAFGVVTGVGVAASVLAWVLARPAWGFVAALRIGAIYLGAFHHVPIRIEGEFDIGELTGGVLPSSDMPTSGSSFVQIGVALVLITAVAAWLLFRAGGRLSSSRPGSLIDHLVRGAAVAPPYALGVVLVATLVRLDEPFGLGRLVHGRLRVSLGVWEALLFPLVIAGVAGAAGGLWAWLGARPDDPRARTAAAALAGGWRMLWLGLALSYAGLFVAGVVQPDEPVAALTPSTARYVDVVFERPWVGAVVLVHHVALAPNEAAWTLVPAAGGCDVAWGSERTDLLCYRRFPREWSGVLDQPDGGAGFGSAPAGYLLFLLAPAIASVLGGRLAAVRSDRARAPGAKVGALAGVPFALLLGATSVLAGVGLRYGGAVGGQGGGGSVWIGPSIAGAVILGLAWGVLGGALGGATAGLRPADATPAGRPGAR